MPPLALRAQGISAPLRLVRGGRRARDRHGVGRGHDAGQRRPAACGGRRREALAAHGRPRRARPVRPRVPHGARGLGHRPPRHLARQRHGPHELPLPREAGGGGAVRPLPHRLRLVLGARRRRGRAHAGRLRRGLVHRGPRDAAPRHGGLRRARDAHRRPAGAARAASLAGDRRLRRCERRLRAGGRPCAVRRRGGREPLPHQGRQRRARARLGPWGRGEPRGRAAARARGGACRRRGRPAALPRT